MPPLILVCGWTNADAAQVDAYLEMYKKLGYHALMLPSHGIDFFLPERWVHGAAVDQVRRLAAGQAASLGLIPHVMSNGGCRSWYCFENQLLQARVPFHVVSMVFDSCPSIPGALSDDPITTQVRQTPFLRHLVAQRFVWRWILVFLHLLLWLTGRKHPFTLHYLRYLIRDAATPKLFLYSSADELVSTSDIQGAIQTAQSMGSSITCVDFEASQHVSHLNSNPALYASSIQAFVTTHAPRFETQY
ncbi:hypothetical protein AaE_004705 [Aphanomyces astaci]|uniref:AB hydrolase-1 domain-containing protein n=1 Tax=Aphanomyces astaci TaxID=112090 RepID=A0A6A5AR50_APHAT|nr:hypothetical protein AaE_004705 [Aphanomyces astaci]